MKSKISISPLWYPNSEYQAALDVVSKAEDAVHELELAGIKGSRLAKARLAARSAHEALNSLPTPKFSQSHIAERVIAALKELREKEQNEVENICKKMADDPLSTICWSLEDLVKSRTAVIYLDLAINRLAEIEKAGSIRAVDVKNMVDLMFRKASEKASDLARFYMNSSNQSSNLMERYQLKLLAGFGEDYATRIKYAHEELTKAIESGESVDDVDEYPLSVL